MYKLQYVLLVTQVAFRGTMQVCQADHNVVFTALGEEQTDYGERDAEDGDGV